MNNKAAWIFLLLLSVVLCSVTGQEAATTTLDAETATEVGADGEATSESTEDQQQEATAETIPETSADEPVPVVKDSPSSANVDDSEQSTTETAKQEDANVETEEAPVQTGPFVDLFGPTLLNLIITGDTGRIEALPTNDALKGKSVVGLYFSADWCGPCRQFTPQLVKFYEKINARKGKQKDSFQIVWMSRCRDMNGYSQYLTQMPWIAIPPEEAMGARGQMLSEKFGVKGIPTLVLLDEYGGVITKDARNLVPKDMAGIGFPWRNPIATVYMTLIPRRLRALVKNQIQMAQHEVVRRIKSLLPFPKKATA